jgi:hypothetical protein
MGGLPLSLICGLLRNFGAGWGWEVLVWCEDVSGGCKGGDEHREPGRKRSTKRGQTPNSLSGPLRQRGYTAAAQVRRLRTAQIRIHSASQPGLPRRQNRRRPRLCLVSPNTVWMMRPRCLYNFRLQAGKLLGHLLRDR